MTEVIAAAIAGASAKKVGALRKRRAVWKAKISATVPLADCRAVMSWSGGAKRGCLTF